MKFLSLSLSLLVNACLAADNSSSFSSNPNPNISLPRLQRVAGKGEIAFQQEDESEAKKLQKYVDFDPKKYDSDLKSKQVSIKAASQMSITELNDLESTSETFASKAQKNGSDDEHFVHMANYYLAKLFKLEKPGKVQQSTFDAWKDSGFSDVKFMDIKETLKLNQDGSYCKQLAEYAGGWHLNTGNVLQFSVEDSLTFKYHMAQSSAINFIYHGIFKLNKSDSADLEKCIEKESLDDIRALAKKFVTSKQYSMEELRHFVMKTSIDNDFAQGNKIALLANVLILEIRLAWKENVRKNTQNILRDRGIEFDVKFSVESKDPMSIVKAYSLCIEKSADDDTKDSCVLAVLNIRDIVSDLERLDDLVNKFNNNAAENNSYFMLKNVVEPAIIFINTMRISKDWQALGEEEFTILLQDDKVKFLNQKVKDYEEHIHDFEYIRSDFDQIANAIRMYGSQSEVTKIVQELKKDRKDQMCSIDFTINKLICNSPEMLDIFINIYQNKYACKTLLEFLESIIANQSLSNAIEAYEEQCKLVSNLYDARYSVILALHPLQIKLY